MMAGCKAGRYQIKPRGYSHFLTVRGNTSDYAVFHTIFCRHAYPIPKGSSIHVVVDAGANVGYASVYFARHCPEARIIAIEPETSNYKILARNTAGYNNIKTLNAALSSSRKTMSIANPQAEKWAFRFSDDTESSREQKIEALAIPDILREFDLPFIDILKMDIEGGEKDVFGQNTQWLSSVRHIFIEIHRGCWKTIATALIPYNFDCKISREYLVIELQSIK